MSVYSRIQIWYSRTSIRQDVARLVNEVAVFVVLDGWRSWALPVVSTHSHTRRTTTQGGRHNVGVCVAQSDNDSLGGGRSQAALVVGRVSRSGPHPAGGPQGRWSIGRLIGR